MSDLSTGPPYELPGLRQNISSLVNPRLIGGAVVTEHGQLASDDYAVGATGWVIKGDGSVEFNNGTFRGAIEASTIDIGGADASSFHVDASGNLWLGDAIFASAPFRVASDGTLTAGDGNFTVSPVGVITAGSGSFQVSALGVVDINAARFDSAGIVIGPEGPSSETAVTFEGGSAIIYVALASGDLVLSDTSGITLDVNGSGTVLVDGNLTAQGDIVATAGGGVTADGHVSAGGTVFATSGVNSSGTVVIGGNLQHTGSGVGFYNTAPILKPTVNGTTCGTILLDLCNELANLGLINATSLLADYSDYT